MDTFLNTMIYFNDKLFIEIGNRKLDIVMICLHYI